MQPFPAEGLLQIYISVTADFGLLCIPRCTVWLLIPITFTFQCSANIGHHDGALAGAATWLFLSNMSLTPCESTTELQINCRPEAEVCCFSSVKGAS